MRRALYWLLGLLAAFSARAQFFTHYGTADGISDQAVLRLKSDERGYLWLASREGLNRFDGAIFRSYRPNAADSTGMPHGHVERMHQAADGMLWITSGNGGLTRFDPRTDRFHTWERLTGKPDPAVLIPTRAVHAYRPDSILVGLFAQGLWWYLPATGETHRISDPSGEPWTPEEIAPRPGHADELYVRGGEAVWILDARHARWTPVQLPAFDVGKGPAPCTTIHPQGPDTLWVGTWGGGLVRISTHDGAGTRYLPDPMMPLTRAKNIVLALVRQRNGALLVGTERGLLRLDENTGHFHAVAVDPGDAHALPAEAVHALHCDADGITWIGRASGLSKWDPAQNRFVTRRIANRLEQGFTLPRPTSALESDGRALVGTTHGDGLLREEADGSFTALPHPTLATEGYKAVQVHALWRSADQHMYALTGRGLQRIESDGDRLVAVYPRTSAALGNGAILGRITDAQGRWWFARQSRGLVVSDPQHDEPLLFSEDGPEHRRLSSAVWCQGLAQDRAGRIWVTAYEQGLDRIAPDLQRIDHLRFADHPWMRTSRIWDLVIDQDDRLWLGTNGQGIIVTPASDPGGAGTVHLLGGPSGTPSMISTLERDDAGRIWAGGPSGLFRIDPSDFAVERYGPSEGLRHTDMHHAWITEHASGRFTIGARNGELITVHGRDLGGEPGPLRMAIAGIRVNGQPWASDTAHDALRTLVLEPHHDQLEVAFGVIAFTLRDKVRICYQLLGVDAEPRVVGAQGTANYSKLPAGRYTLVLCDARHPDQVLRSLAITLKPWFWRTWWFGVLVASVVVLLVTATWRWRLRVLRERDRVVAEQQRRMAAFELQALRAQMDPHFLFNSLNSINRFIIRNEARIASEYLTKFARLIRRVLQHSKERLIPLKDELEALRLYVELEALRFADGFSYSAEVELADDPATIMVPPMLLQPYVENAIWHGLMHKRDTDRRLLIRVRNEGASTLFEVEDNGIGRAEAMRLREEQEGPRRSMGMRINRERIELLGDLTGMDATVQVIDLHDLHQRPTGTRVVVRITPREP